MCGRYGQWSRRQRPLGVDETLPAKADLAGKIVALNKEASACARRRPPGMRPKRKMRRTSMATRNRERGPQRTMPNDATTPKVGVPIRTFRAGTRGGRAERASNDSSAKHLRSSRSPDLAPSTQDRILKAWHQERYLLVYLRSGVKQTGRLAGWDVFSIMIDVGDGVVERIHKKAISSILPAGRAGSRSGDRL
jgi:sRNA-binding regulator protein Hfq